MKWQVLLIKSDLSVNTMLDVVCAYPILNTLILSDKNVEIDAMIEIMEKEIGNFFHKNDDIGAS